jgi:hypothetical protein
MLKDTLQEFSHLKKVHLYLEGTRADGLYCRQLEKTLKNAKNIPDVLITV